MSSDTSTPYRQIRALHDENFITVYQAYNSTIADAAAKDQLLNASPSFKLGRMTWVKPSWCWMMYRCGYSYKDANQAHVLALKMKKENFLRPLDRGLLTKDVTPGEQGARIQWDPERGPRLEVLPYRSIQIGIPGGLSEVWVREWIEEIDDVTEKARELKKVLDERPDVTDRELVALGLMPNEEPFEIPEHIAARLGMVDQGNTSVGQSFKTSK